MKRSIWLGVLVGWLAQLGLKTLLPVLALIAVRYVSIATEDPLLWLEHPDDSSHPVWYILQFSIFIGSLLAGWLAAVLSPRSVRTPAVLVLLSLAATAFEQFPKPMTPVVLCIWTLGPCLGLLAGWLLQPRLRRGSGQAAN